MRLDLGIGIGSGGGAAPWTPLALGSSLALWLRADMGVTLNGATVSAWADQSGNGRHATQGSAALQPTYQATDANFSGKPSLLFDGSDTMASTAALLAGDTTHAIILACRAVTVVTGVGMGAVGSSTAGTRGTSTIGMWTSGGGVKWWWDGDDLLVNFAGVADTNPHVFAKTYASTSGVMTGYVDGAQAVTYDYDTGAVRPNLSAGYSVASFGSGTANVEIAEMIILSAVPTAAERAALTAYMGSRYGITVT